MKNPERYMGFADGVDITTAGFLYDPQKAFAFADWYNKKHPESHHVGIEVYPTLDRVGTKGIKALARTVGLPQLGVPGVNLANITQWQRKYPLSRVTSVHLPFAYDEADLLRKVPRDVKDGNFSRASHNMAWIAFLGSAINGHGVEIANGLQSDLTVHTPILEGLLIDQTTGQRHFSDRRRKRANALAREMKRVPREILAENDVPHVSSLLTPDEISNPITIAYQFMQRKYPTTGILIGVDHAIDEELDIEEIFSTDAVRKHTKAIHIAGADHGVDIGNDQKLQKAMSIVRATPFAHQVRARLDYNPNQLRELSERELFQKIERDIEEIVVFKNPN